ncbi:MAG: ABC transporter permease [Brachybacterium sp.]|uniref:ABC transporter permease n=1 Tax=Brachybacterium sp. TaxID=1891286 RepID=UPI002647AE58|nr:ABC transporter permease [Brachybacterium sp.]MDN5685476.1 ABC transporter permease [Brachybacterium sp.]
MRRILLRALLRAVPVLLVTAAVTFLLGVFAKQEPAELLLGEAATAEAVAALDHELGRDRPLPVRFASWIGNALQGDLGESWFTGIAVTDTIAQRLPVSLSIAGLALAIALVLGTGAGILAALHRGSGIDTAVTLAASTLATLPPFVVSILLILVFGVAVPILPTGGFVPLAQDPLGWLACIILPAIALSLEAAADIARQLRTALVATYEENFVIGARLRGHSEARILLRHALPHAAGPALSVVGIQVPRLVGGAIIAEQIFSLPGLGLMAFDGAMQGDMPVVLGAVMVTVAAVLASTLVIDLLLTALNPKERTAARTERTFA